MIPNLYVMIGLSGSGKSTISKILSKENNCIIVSSDDIRGEICDNGVIDQTKNNEVFKIFHNRIKMHLNNGNNVIADATNINLKSRRCILDSIKNIECNKIAYIIPKPLEQCIEDNIYREYPVPHHVIQKQEMNYQIPFYEEGFDKIIIHKFNEQYLNLEFLKCCKNAMSEYNQNNPHHNMTLGEHCNYTYNKFKTYNYERCYNIGAMIHDIGKLYTQKTDENGISHYYQHENVGCYYLLSNINSLVSDTYMTDDEVLKCLFLINYHMMPMSWNTEKSKNKWKKIFGDEKYNLLLKFNQCDKSRT